MLRSVSLWYLDNVLSCVLHLRSYKYMHVLTSPALPQQCLTKSVFRDHGSNTRPPAPQAGTLSLCQLRDRFYQINHAQHTWCALKKHLDVGDLFKQSQTNILTFGVSA